MVSMEYGYVLCDKCRKPLNTTQTVKVYADVLLEDRTRAEYVRTVIYTKPVAQSLYSNPRDEMKIAKELHDILEKNPPKVTVDIKTVNGKVYHDINDIKFIKIYTKKIVETLSGYCPKCKMETRTDENDLGSYHIFP
ncbi:MAG: hypothetical protein ACP5T9_03155 [Thermoplasmata archaeon]